LEAKDTSKKFIREFEDVASLTKWLAQVRLFQLRTCLTGPAKSYPFGPDVGHIFQALRFDFRMTARTARDCLQTICRDKKTLLQDHANAIEVLAQVAHGNDNHGSEETQYTRPSFTSLTTLGYNGTTWLSNSLPSKKALVLGKAYYQIEGPQGTDFAANQVD